MEINMSKMSEMFYKMLNKEQDRYIEMKCDLYTDNFNKISGYINKEGFSTKDIARAALILTKIQLSAIRMYTIDPKDVIVVPRQLYPNSKMYTILKLAEGAFPYLNIVDTRYEVYFKLIRVRINFSEILDYYIRLRHKVYTMYSKMEGTFKVLEGVDRRGIITFSNGYLFRLLEDYILGTKSYCDIDYSALALFLSEGEIETLRVKLLETDILGVAEVRTSKGTLENYLHLEPNTSKSKYKSYAGTELCNSLYLYIKKEKLLSDVLLDQLFTEELG